jgi:protease I
MARKKVMLVLPPRDVDADMYLTLRRVFEGRGHQVGTTSVVRGAVLAQDGRSIPVDESIHHITRYTWDAYVFMGGEGTRLYFDDPHIKKLIEDVKFKTIAAEGNASVLLAQGNLLARGKKATGDYHYASMIVEHGGVYTGTPMEIDDKIITLREPMYAEQFANAIAEKIEG